MKIPSYQALPFVWAVGGYTKYVNPNAIQDLKNYGENGLSFHAYSFLRKETDNTLYRDTVRFALIELKNQGKIGQESVDKFNSICKRFDHGIESAEDIKKNHENKSAPFQMMQFWQDHCEK